MTKIIVTLGPSTNRQSDLLEMKKLGVDYVRANMSHTSLEDLGTFITLAKNAGIPFLLDTEGPQVRTGKLIARSIPLRENDTIALHRDTVIGDSERISLRPAGVIDTLREGDHIYFDGTLLLRVLDVSTRSQGYVTAIAVRPGRIGENKGLAIDSIHGNGYRSLPALSPKDHASILLGLREEVGAIAASFIRNANDVDAVRAATGSSMKIFSKVECQDALSNLDGILEQSDGIIVDRHDLCKEIPRERIFYTQKQIFDRARGKGKPAFASSFMLESMVDNERPSEHERYNALMTLKHGAAGLVLSAETTVGAYPLKSIETLKSIIASHHALPEYVLSG